MRALLCLLAAAGLLAVAYAGSGKDVWGIDTLVNYPAGQGRKEVPVQANDDGKQAPIDLPCQCSDADPRGEQSQAVEVPCYWQRHYGKCGETYMFDANAELAPEGFCQISCGRCACCQDAYATLQQLGANRFLQALEATQPSLKDLLQHPGFAATLLVPTDDAFDAALAKYGALLQNPALLQELLKFHIVPPEPVRRGLWTSPMLSLGPKLYTLYDGPQALSVPKFELPANTTWRGGLTGFQVQGPYNAATVVQSDIPACKSYITLIDAVLLPFDPAAPPANTPTAAADLLGAKGCGVQPNAAISGQQLSTTRVGTIGQCCQACAATAGCNAWTYCSQKGGCYMPNGGARPYGSCALLRSPELAAGNAPAYTDFSAVTVPLTSGWVIAASQATPAATAPQPTVQAAAGGRKLFAA